MKTKEIFSFYEKIEDIPSFWLPDTQRMRCLHGRNFCFLFFQQIFKVCKEKVSAPDPIGSSSIQYFRDNVYNSNSVFTWMHYYDGILHWIRVFISTQMQCKKAVKNINYLPSLPTLSYLFVIFCFTLLFD